MDALDGNALAGELHAIFGRELTADIATCGACGATSYLAEIAVYLRAPGMVGRCRSCDNVLLVLTTVRGVACVDMRGFAAW
jgi:hypothetical protein